MRPSISLYILVFVILCSLPVVTRIRTKLIALNSFHFTSLSTADSKWKIEHNKAHYNTKD
jgi:hypothetical protein